MPRCRHTVIAAALAVLLPAALASARPAARQCGSVHTHFIDGHDVRVSGGITCAGARSVMRGYFAKVVRTGQVEGGCAQKRLTTGCVIGHYRCRTTGIHTLRGHCWHDGRDVRFREVDRGPG